MKGYVIREEDRCVMCGAYVPEGSPACRACAKDTLSVLEYVIGNTPYKLTRFQKLVLRARGLLAKAGYFIVRR